MQEESPGSTPGTDTDSAGIAKHAKTQAAWLRNALGELTTRQRFVVECRFGLRGDREYNFYEIAGFMGVTHKAVRFHYYRAMARLRQLADGTHFPFIGERSVSGPEPPGAVCERLAPSTESDPYTPSGTYLPVYDPDSGEYMGLDFDPWEEAIALLDS